MENTFKNHWLSLIGLSIGFGKKWYKTDLEHLNNAIQFKSNCTLTSMFIRLLFLCWPFWSYFPYFYAFLSLFSVLFFLFNAIAFFIFCLFIGIFPIFAVSTSLSPFLLFYSYFSYAFYLNIFWDWENVSFPQKTNLVHHTPWNLSTTHIYQPKTTKSRTISNELS